jgi:hypothetical protein
MTIADSIVDCRLRIALLIAIAERGLAQPVAAAVIVNRQYNRQSQIVNQIVNR